jgi:hypothetical protein
VRARVIGALAVLGLLASLRESPTVEAFCTRPEKVTFADIENGNSVTLFPRTGVIEFELEDGRKLVGESARSTLSPRRVTAYFRSADLTITLRGDLVHGRGQAAAVERLPGYNPVILTRDDNGKVHRVAKGGTRDQNRKTYTVTAAGGPPQGFECVAGPDKPPTSRPR